MASPPVETGWFNEDDATSSPGGFKDANQVYYINYRYTWDGDTTPGITISQRYGRTPFCLYGLTNQVVPGEELGIQAAKASRSRGCTSRERRVDRGFHCASADQVGVTSDTFYSDETLNSNGEWVDVEGYGRSWRPTRCRRTGGLIRTADGANAMTAVGPGSQMTTWAGARTITAAGPILRIRAGAGRRAPFGRRRGSPGDAEPARIAEVHRLGAAPAGSRL